MFDTSASFSSDYQEARSKFLKEATAVGGVVDAISHPERGPDGRPLFTDVAAFGLDKADKVLVLISGTHGAEGFCGSGAQIDLLRRGEIARLPKGVGILMIHGINPYGFAWLRRVTNENIDLNRNWIDFNQPLPQNPTYSDLHTSICPQTWKAETKNVSWQVIESFTEKHGFAALQQAISGGQYSHPSGLFFGGTAPSWSRLTQERIFSNYLTHAERVAVIDYHSALGPWGFAEQMIIAPKSSKQFERAAEWYGSAATSVIDGASSSAKVGGSGLEAVPQLLPQAEVTCMAFEVGTVSPLEVLSAMQADCWLHTHGDPQSAEAAPIKAEIRRCFYGDVDDWKGMVTGQSLLAVRQTLIGLDSRGCARKG